MSDSPVILVTGASSGIGEATARQGCTARSAAWRAGLSRVATSSSRFIKPPLPFSVAAQTGRACTFARDPGEDSPNAESPPSEASKARKRRREPAL